METPVPHEAVTFLRSHRTFDADLSDSECGAVLLTTVGALKVREFWVDGDERDWLDDPHRGDHGYYVVPGVDLVSHADGYDPGGLLIWIPKLSLFGTWDCDHRDLIAFEDVRWQDIVRDPIRFLDSQWNLDQPFSYLKPWVAGFEWRSGTPF